MENDKILVEEIKGVQEIIKRMASNSFFIKGWTITVVFATLFLRFDKNNSLTNILVALFPLLLFWYLDAYFLQQEKLFREVHNWIRTNRLNSDEHLFDYDPSRFLQKVESAASLMLSETLAWFYGLTFIAIIITGAILFISSI